MQLFHLYWYHFLKKYSRNPFSHFLLRFLLFRIRTPGAFAKLHNGNLQHFPRKCPRRENAKAMKLCVQAIYICFPFLIPQRYIWVKKKALSGNVIKLSKSAHTKINIPRPSRGYFLCGRSPMLPATPHAALVRLAICIGYPTHTGISPAPFHSYIAVIPNTYAFSSA